MRNDAKDEASSSEEVVVSAADPESIKVCRETTYHLRRIGEDNGRYSVRVVGAGQMGSGIAQLATNGLDVWLMDALESPQLSPLSIVSSPKA